MYRPKKTNAIEKAKSTKGMSLSCCKEAFHGAGFRRGRRVRIRRLDRVRRKRLMNPTVRSVQPNPTKKVHVVSNLLPLGSKI